MRITKVTTRNGDGGKTNLAKGESVLKSDNIIHCLGEVDDCLLYTSPSPRDSCASRMPSSA